MTIPHATFVLFWITIWTASAGWMFADEPDTASNQADMSASANPSTAVSPEPKQDSSDISRQLDVPFGDDEQSIACKCDLYFPAVSDSSVDRPVVMVVHGGGWISGDKWTMNAHCEILARQGYVVVNINYRLAPSHKFPRQLDDVRSALLWIQKQSETLRLDLDRLGVFGYSAGGHLSALLAVLANESIDKRTRASEWKKDDPRWAKLPKIKAVCVGGPPCDFRILPPDNTSLSYFLGGSRSQLPLIYDVASPTANVSAGDPPVQIIHGDADLLVPIENSRAFQKAMQSAGVECRLKVLPGHGHVITFLHEDLKQTMIDWFAERL